MFQLILKPLLNFDLYSYLNTVIWSIWLLFKTSYLINLTVIYKQIFDLLTVIL